MVPSSVLLDRVSIIHPDLYKVSDETNDTARSYRIPGYCGSFGFISSMSDHFCGSCNRLRITADGQIKVDPYLFLISGSSTFILRRSVSLIAGRYP